MKSNQKQGGAKRGAGGTRVGGSGASATPATATRADPGAGAAAGPVAAVLAEVERRLGRGEVDAAIAVLDGLCGTPPVAGEAIARWCALMIERGRQGEAAQRLAAWLAEHPDEIAYGLTLAVIERDRGRFDAAAEALRRAESQRPGNASVLFDLGVAEAIRGDLAAAQDAFERSLAIRPDHAVTLHRFGVDHKYAAADPAFARLLRASARIVEMAPADQVAMLFALGKAWEDLGDLGTAMSFYDAGGRRRGAGLVRDARRKDGPDTVIRTVFRREQFQLPAAPGCASELPVFIVGMPRSGTTLIEQVLASHPQVFGAGELKFLRPLLKGMRVGRYQLQLGDDRDWHAAGIGESASVAERGERYVEQLRALAPAGFDRVVDKMPGNYLYVGPIHLMLPKARIIHSRRHPVETCLSCYRRLFADGHDWSFDLAELGRHYRRYDAMVRHWREALPGRMLEVRYEDMVGDLAAQARRLIEHLGVPWDERCLAFHEAQRPVRTNPGAVRQPIYKRSSGRWREYQPWIGPLLEELGSLVDEYEDELAATRRPVPETA